MVKGLLEEPKSGREAGERGDLDEGWGSGMPGCFHTLVLSLQRCFINDVFCGC